MFRDSFVAKEFQRGFSGTGALVWVVWGKQGSGVGVRRHWRSRRRGKTLSALGREGRVKGREKGREEGTEEKWEEKREGKRKGKGEKERRGGVREERGRKGNRREV